MKIIEFDADLCTVSLHIFFIKEILILKKKTKKKVQSFWKNLKKVNIDIIYFCRKLYTVGIW